MIEQPKHFMRSPRMAEGSSCKSEKGKCRREASGARETVALIRVNCVGSHILNTADQMNFLPIVI